MANVKLRARGAWAAIDPGTGEILQRHDKIHPYGLTSEPAELLIYPSKAQAKTAVHALCKIVRVNIVPVDPR